MKKLRIPQQLLSVDNDTKIKCLVKKKYSVSNIRDGLLEALKISMTNNQLSVPNKFVIPLVVGKFSDQNQNGSTKRRDDLPKETIFYTQNRTITDWHRNEHDLTINMPYKRYPREIIPAQKIKINSHLINSNNNVFELGFVFDNIITKGNNNWEDNLLFLINLSLELFDEFDLVDVNTDISLLKIIKTNWNILPPGEYPFEIIEERIKQEIKKSKIPLDQFELKRLDFFKPMHSDFTAIGTGGFKGYVIFGFEEKGLYLLENFRIGNAIYIFDNAWKDYSQKTKKELIGLVKNNGKVRRIVHNGNWQQKINALFM